VPPLTPILLEGRISRSQKEHDEIMKRLVARDAAGAAHAMDRHIGNAVAELRKTMDTVIEPKQPNKGSRRSKQDHG
jgi:DNA-binding GntR family transcriptional regulator